MKLFYLSWIVTVLFWGGLIAEEGVVKAHSETVQAATNALPELSEKPLEKSAAEESTLPITVSPDSTELNALEKKADEKIEKIEKIEVAPSSPVMIEESVVKKAERVIPVAPAVSEVSPSIEGIRSMTIPEGTAYFLGARYFEKKSGGWGWIKKPEESWKKARWVAIKETPRQFHIPHRALAKPEIDHEFQYKLLGYFADYQVYDPVRDELLDVFVIQGYESLGLQKSIERLPGPPSRFVSRKSGAYTRRNEVQVNDDSF